MPTATASFRSAASKAASAAKASKATPKGSKPAGKGSKYRKVATSKRVHLGGRSSSEDDSDDTPQSSSSDNLAKLPSLSEEDYIYFKLVRDGDLNGLKDFIKSELFSKIHINKTDRLGFSALHYAVRRQDEEIVSLLLSQEGILTYDTLLHAIQEGNVDITKDLLSYEDSHKPPQQGQVQGQGTVWPMATSLASTTLTAGARLSINSLRSPTKVTLKRSLQDLEEFDSEFPPHCTPLLKSAQTGNADLMEIFYSRGDRLETPEQHHNCECGCRVCSRADTTLTTAYERLHLYQALTNPKYICFISGKQKNFDPINYAIEKIRRCRQLIDEELAFDDKYAEYIGRLVDFTKDILSLCRSNDETEVFLSIPDSSSNKAILSKYPRLWSAVGLELTEFVAHPHAQNVVYKQWAVSAWPEWDTYSRIRQFAEVPLRIIGLPFISIYLWLGSKTRFGRKMASPVSRFLNWVASYILFLALVFAQAMLPQRCNNQNKVPYSVPEGKCDQRGAPNIGTEWLLVLYVLGFFVSMLKRHAIPWFWSSSWSWYELASQLLFIATFLCWIVAWAEFHPAEEERKVWGQYYPEVLAELLLSLAVIFAFGRTLRVLQLHWSVGPLQIALVRMVKSFFFASLMYSIVIFAFCIGLNAIYIPYNELEGFDSSGNAATQSSPFGGVLTAPEELFWSMFGMSGTSTTDIVSLGSKVNDAVINIRHHWVNELAGKVMFAAFHILGVLMMFNLLVAYFSAHGDGVMENADAEWKFARTQVYMTYMKDTVLPPPFNLIPTLRSILRFFEYLGLLCLGDGVSGNASCSLRQCCFIEEPKDPYAEKNKRQAYRKLILVLTHRYKLFIEDKESKEPATSDDVKEIVEELAELKSQVESKLRELEGQEESSTGQPPMTSVSSEELNMILQDPGTATQITPSAVAQKLPASVGTSATSRRMVLHKSSKGLVTKLSMLVSGKPTSVLQKSKNRISSISTSGAQSSPSQRTLGQASILPGSSTQPTPTDFNSSASIQVPPSPSRNPTLPTTPIKPLSDQRIPISLSRSQIMPPVSKKSSSGHGMSIPLSQKPTVSTSSIKSPSAKRVSMSPSGRQTTPVRVNSKPSNGGIASPSIAPPPTSPSLGMPPRPPPPISSKTSSGLSLPVQLSESEN